jgi:hypothetical protein
MALEQGPNQGLHRRQEPRQARHYERGHDPNAFFGLDVEAMSPEAHVAVGAVVIVPVVLAATLVLVLAPSMWWLIFTFGWAIFPAFGLFIRGIAGVLDGERGLSTGNGKERELLGALREHGELTPARAAMETSLTVAEADEMLKGLAEGGHLEVRVKGGSLSYALWESEGAALGPGERV